MTEQRSGKFERVTFASYSRWLFAFAALVLCACAAWNRIIDPYDLFGGTRIAGINQLKPAAESRVRITKPYRVREVNPASLILGNSRPEIGLDPSYACWPLEMKPVYNLAMLGTGLYTNYRNLQHAAYQSHVKHAFLGLDFLFFVSHDENAEIPEWDPPDRDFEHLQVFADGSVNRHYDFHRLVNELRALFSLKSLQDAIRTVLAQDDPTAKTLNPDGHNPGRFFLDIVASEGQGALFAHKNAELARIFAREMHVFQGRGRWSQSLETLRRILEFGRSRGIEITLFINPRHADFLSLVSLSGKWGILEDWKRAVTLLAADYGAKVWDFHDFDEFSTQPAPRRVGDVLPGFWEPGHYRSALGDLMLDSMLAQECHSGAPKVGALLQPETLESHLEVLRERQQQYARTHMADHERLRATYARFAKE